MNRIIGAVITHLFDLKEKYRIENYKKCIQGDGYRLGNVQMAYPQNISIGKGTYINSGFIMASPDTKIRIGENCLISYNVHMRTDMHNYEVKDELINKQGVTHKDIVIEDDVWIGFGVQIMPGVVIRKGSVIGAGGVVTHSTEEYGVYAGIPAKKIKERK